MLLTYPFAFDSAVASLTWLFDGHTLHMLTTTRRTDADYIVDYVRTSRIDHVDCVPALMNQLLDAGLLDGRPRTCPRSSPWAVRPCRRRCGAGSGPRPSARASRRSTATAPPNAPSTPPHPGYPATPS